MKRGYIRLWRKLRDSAFWYTQKRGGRASDCEAWLDLLMRANHAPGAVKVDGQAVHLERGEQTISVRFLASRWRWSKDRVMRHLAHLKQGQQITLTQGQGYTLLKVLNYELYQGGGISDKDTQTSAGEHADKDAGKDKGNTLEGIKENSARSRGGGLNAWKIWVGEWQKAGRTPDPTPTGKNTKAAKQIAAYLKGDEAKLREVYRRYLSDRDSFIERQGYSTAFLLSRLDAYLGGRNGEGIGRGCGAGRQRIEGDSANKFDGIKPLVVGA